MSTTHSVPAADPATAAGEADLRITAVETFRISDRFLLVKVSTDAGIAGWGEPILESRAETVEAAVRELADLLIGEPMQIGRLWQRMHKSGFYRGGPILGSAVAGLDQALWDVLGKALRVPVHVLLGGPVRDVLPLYAPANGADDDALVDRVQKLCDAGYRTVKTAPEGPREFLETPTRLHATMRRWERLAEAIGPDRTFAIDFHGRATPALSRALIKELEPTRPAFIEEPCLPENVDAMAEIKASTTVPIATGERLFTRWGFRDAIERRIADIYQPDVCHAGGISELVKIATMADCHFTQIAPHNPLGPIALAASLQVDCACGNLFAQELIGDLGADLLTTPFEMIDGMIPAPSGPGLGIEINLEALEAARGDGGWRTPALSYEDGSVAAW